MVVASSISGVLLSAKDKWKETEIINTQRKLVKKFERFANNQMTPHFVYPKARTSKD